MATKALITVEEFAKMKTAENEAYELVDGELIALPSATPLHGLIRDRTSRLVWSYFDQKPIGGSISELDCRIGDEGVRRPDVSIFLGERWRQLDMRRVPAPYAPDIAVEVLSPSELVVDLNHKVRDYLSAGSQEVWLLDPENCELHVRTKTGIQLLQTRDTLESPLLPGFSVVVETLLAGRP